jgi:hypothetical protein
MRWKQIVALSVFPLVLQACTSAAPAKTPESTPVSVKPAEAATVAPPPPRETSAASLVDHLGDSTTTAVSVPANAPEEGVPFENNWIFDRFGRFRRLGGGTGQENGRRYDMIKFELPDHSEHTVYFDITENWSHWAPPH